MAEYGLLRKDLLDHPGVRRLSCDYLVQLACCVLHPRASSADVVCWTAAAARVVGFEHQGAISGLRVLAERGLIVFDEETLETWPVDHFLVNQAPGGKNGFYNKERERALLTIKSERIRQRYALEAAAAAGRQRLEALMLPRNLVSAFGVRGGRLMLSDAAAMLAACCNPYLSAAGIGPMDYELLSLLTNQAAPAAETGLANIAARGVIEIDAEACEYRVRRHFDLPSKLVYPAHLEAAVSAAESAESKRLGRAALKAICAARGQKKNEIRAEISAIRNEKKKKNRISVETTSDFTPEKAMESEGSGTHNSTQHSTTLPSTTQHSTPAASPAVVTEKAGGVVVVDVEQEESQKRRLLAAGWSAKDADTILDSTKRLLKTAEQRVALLRHFEIGVDPAKVQNLGGLLSYFARQVAGGTLVTTPIARTAGALATQTPADDGSEEWEAGWANGRSMRDIERVGKALRNGDWAAAVAAAAAAGCQLPPPPPSVIAKYGLKIEQ